MVYTAQHMILHIDADAFFASCEQATKLSLRGKPIAVGKDRGVATAFSYEAKRLGVTRGMRSQDIKKQFPQVIFVDSDYQKYSMFSARMVTILKKYIPEVEKTSIDECFADVTGLDKLYNTTYPELIARIQEEICVSLGFTCSIGVGPNKLIAKIASRLNKPKGLVFFKSPSFTKSHLMSMPVGEISGIGTQTQKRFESIGVRTIDNFYHMRRETVSSIFGKVGLIYYDELHGEYIRKVETSHKDQQSFSRVRAFSIPTSNFDYLYAEVAQHVEVLSQRLRASNMQGLKMVVGVKTFEKTFYSLEHTLHPSNDTEYLLHQAKTLLAEVIQSKVKYRATYVCFTLVKKLDTQLDLFTKTSEISSELGLVIDGLNKKFGTTKVTHLSSMVGNPGHIARSKRLIYPLISFE